MSEGNHRHRSCLIGIVLACLGLAAQAGTAKDAGPDVSGKPAQYTLTGVVRDFRANHVDFNPPAPEGRSHIQRAVANNLGADGTPVWVGKGRETLSQATDSSKRPICWTLVDSGLGDTPPVFGKDRDGAVTSAATFHEWFNDYLGVNMSMTADVTARLIKDGADPYYGWYKLNIAQFWPVDDMLFGNDSDHNNYFTFELVTHFTYSAAAKQQMMFKSEDDAWVFINGKLVADLMGLQGSPEQWVDLNRLGLEDGKEYVIHLFTNNRSGNARLHMLANFEMQTLGDPTINAPFD